MKHLAQPHITGLSTNEVKALQREHGLNVLKDCHRRTIFSIFFEQFASVLPLLLLAAAVVAFVLGEHLDAQLIIFIVLMNAVFGVYQEKKAEAAIDALRNMTKEHVRVIRNGIEEEIEGDELVPGDIVYIEEGIKIPADGELVEATTIELNEASLTGESMPVLKKTSEKVFAGTIVSKGRGIMKVTATGMKTEFGEIAAKLSRIDESKTLLEKKLEGISKILGIIGVAGSFAVILLSYTQGSSLVTALLLGTSLAVAVVPEGLAAVMTVTLAMGVRDMAKKKAILRKLAAIEALGSVSLLATDKTGTLTKNSMEVTQIWADGTVEEVTEKYKVRSNTVKEIIKDGMLCSTASLEKVSGGSSTKSGSKTGAEYKMLGDPTEGALLIFSKLTGFNYDEVRVDHPIIDEVPFDSETKMMSVTVNHTHAPVTYMKGATESILKHCDTIQLGEKKHKLDTTRRKLLLTLMENWAKDGLRVLAFASRAGGEQATGGKATFLGMVAMYDPPRLEAKSALQKAAQAGIRVVMVTGDNPVTANAIAKKIGFIQEGELIVTGDELEKMTDRELIKKMPNIRIYARVSPFHKSRIVQLYQKLGEIVAVTGDGVNDSIALKQADVGVAMGRTGTDVAREVADMVITDDNFTTIITAIEEGRNIIKNLKNAIKYLLATNLAEAIAIVGSLVLGIPHLFFAVQILYINLVTDGIPALALAFSPRQKNSMSQPPDKSFKLLKKFDLAYIGYVGTVAGILVLGSYELFENILGGNGRTAAFCVLALIQPFVFMDLWVTHGSYVKNLKAFGTKIFVGAFLIIIVLQFILVLTPDLATRFHTDQVPLLELGMYMVVAAIIIPAIKVFHRIYPGRE